MNAKNATPSCSLRILLRNFSRVASFVVSVLLPDEAWNLALACRKMTKTVIATHPMYPIITKPSARGEISPLANARAAGMRTSTPPDTSKRKRLPMYFSAAK